MPAARSRTLAILVACVCLSSPAFAQTARLLDGRNQAIDPATGSLSISQLVTNGDTWPSPGYDSASPSTADVRAELSADSASAKQLTLAITLESVDAESGKVHAALPLTAARPAGDKAFRSDFIRLVGDDTDREARGVQGRTLRVALRDLVVVRQ